MVLALSVVLALCFGTLAGIEIIPRFRFGGVPLAITSDAMAPTLRQGDLAIVQPVYPGTISAGDVVAFNTYSDELATKRVVDLVHGEDGAVASLVARSDAGRAEQSKVSVTAVKGRVVYSVPHLGRMLEASTILWVTVFGIAMFSAIALHRRILVIH
jgi:signal peptidase I